MCESSQGNGFLDRPLFAPSERIPAGSLATGDFRMDPAQEDTGKVLIDKCANII